MNKHFKAFLCFTLAALALVFVSCAHTHVHKFQEFVAEKPATCEVAGQKGYQHCDECGKNYDKDGVEITDLVIPALGHDLKHVDRKEATCEEDGNIEYWHCQRCGENFSDAEGKNKVTEVKTNKLGHDYELKATWLGGNAAHYLVCKNNNEHVINSNAEEYSATVTSETVDPECSTKGSTTYTLTVTYDGKTYTATNVVELAALGHNIIPVKGQAATTQASGYLNYFECQNCHACYEDENGETPISDIAAWKAEGGNGYIAPIDENHEHVYTKINGKNPTCEKAGYKDFYYCTLCGTYFAIENDSTSIIADLDAWVLAEGKLNALGHDLEEVRGEDATQTEAGYKSFYTCSECDKDFEDAEGLVEITDFQAWISEGGNGYIPPLGSVNPNPDPQPDPNPTEQKDVTYTFTDQYFKSEVNDVEGEHFTSTKEGYGFETRGVQVSKSKSGLVLESVLSYVNVTKIELVLSSNKNVNSIKVTYNNSTKTVDVTKKDNEKYTVEFTGSNEGVINLLFNVSDGSIYISSIRVIYDSTKTVEHEHQYTYAVAWEDAKAYYVGTCSKCQEGDEGHTTKVELQVASEEVKANCTTAGSITYTATLPEGIQNVGYDLTKVVSIPALGHDFDEGTWDWATNHTSAKLTLTCSRCGEKEFNATVTYEEVTAPTTTEAGVGRFTATVTYENKTYTDTQDIAINPHEHTYVFNRFVWNDDQTKGKAALKCSECGAEIYSDELEVTLNQTKSVAPTCTTEGKNVYDVTYETYSGELEKTVARLSEDGKHGNKVPSSEKVTFSTKGYGNGDDVTEVAMTSATISFATGSKYYTTGAAIRVYHGKNFTVTSTSAIKKIELTFGSGDNSNTITVNTGTYSNGVWTGDATSITFSVGGSSDHRRIAAVEVFIGESANYVLTHVAAKDSSCTEHGNDEYWYCERCGAMFSDESTEHEITSAERELAPHTYLAKDISWVWANDYSSVTVGVICKDCQHHEEFTLTATQSANGQITEENGIYTATLIIGEAQFTKVVDSNHVHTYQFSSWTWLDDKSKATAKFVCSDTECGDIHNEIVNSVETITVPATCEADGTRRYTVTTDFDGTEHSDYKEVKIDRLGHDLSHVSYKAATAEEAGNLEYVICNNCGNVYLADKHKETTDLLVALADEEVKDSGEYALVGIKSSEIYNNNTYEYITLLGTDTIVYVYYGISGINSIQNGKVVYVTGSTIEKYEGELYLEDGSAIIATAVTADSVVIGATGYAITYKNEGNVAFDGTHGANHPEAHMYGTDTTLVNPTKTGYDFAGWFDNKECTGDALTKIDATTREDVTLYAKWNIQKFTITWKNEDGTTLETDENVNYGTTPTYDGATPVKTSTAQYEYAWASWTPAVATVTADAIYTATFNETVRNYTVTIAVNDSVAGSVDETSVTVPYGTLIEMADEILEIGENMISATKTTDNAEYTFAFVNWTGAADKDTVSGDLTITANFSKTKNVYSVEMTANTAIITDLVEDIYEYGYVLSFDVTAKNGYDASTLVVKANGTALSIKAETTNTYELTIIEDVIITFEVELSSTSHNIIYRDQNSDDTFSGTHGDNHPTAHIDNETTALVAATRTGYDFGGWFDNKSCTGDAITEITGTLTDAITIYAKWIAHKYNVTIERNNKTYGTVSTALIENVEFGTAISANNNVLTVGETNVTATVTGASAQYTYSFVEWSGIVASMPDEALTITATFAQTTNKYNVIWKNGDATIKTDKVEYNTAPSFTDTDPIKASTAQYEYTFTGWTDGENNYAKNATLPVVTEAITYTATFNETVRNYTITIAKDPADCGSISVTSVLDVPYGTAITVNANEITVGETTVIATANEATAQYTYEFVEWTGVTATVEGAITITANFSKTGKEYTVTFVPGDGVTYTGDATTTVTFGSTYGDLPTKNEISREGYRFDGWYLNDTKITADTVVATAEAHSLTARMVQQFTVTFDAGDGSAVEAQTVDVNGYLTAVTSTYDGYTLVGWFKTRTGDTASYTYSNEWVFTDDPNTDGDQRTKVTEDSTLYSKWEKEVTTEEVTLNFTSISGFNSWGSSYTSHTVQYDNFTVTFASANKQTGTITNQPVTKGGNVNIVAKNGKIIKEVVFTCEQWGSKEQTITLKYSTNGGSSYTSTGQTSSNFVLSYDEIPDNTNAIQFTFSSSSNQVGITSCKIVYE